MRPSPPRPLPQVIAAAIALVALPALADAAPPATPPLPSARIGVPVAVARPDSAAPTYAGCGGTSPAAVNATYEQQVVELVNQQRLANGGLPPYKRVPELDSSTRYHSVDMTQDNYFDHNTNDRVNGILTFTCDFAQRVGTFYTGWTALGENIAAGQTSPAQAVTDWMNSPGHRANILSTAYWEASVGYASGGNYGHYWTNDFGRRAVYPLVINREAASTSSPSVQLYVYGSWAEIRLRNENGSFGAWQPFSNNLSWTLSGGAAGVRTVTAEMRSGGSSTTASDDILLTAGGTGPTATPVPPTAVPSATATRIATRTATPPASPTRTNTPAATPTLAGTATPSTVARGDCNGDHSIGSADMTALTLELFDGDGNTASNAPLGTYPGSAIGCDSNRDNLITSADITCIVLILFDGPGACP